MSSWLAVEKIRLSANRSQSHAASYRTANFIIEAPTTELATEIGKTAERYRRDLAIEWLGKEMPNWSKPCPITAKVDPKLGAGGATSFVFDHGEVFGWTMNIQGSRERVLDSVLPHEVTHTIFASHFRQPLPRWADEGACTTVEHESEKNKQSVLLVNFLQTNRGIAFNQMFAMKEYPKDVIPLYAQGYSLARFLIEQGGRRKFMAFVGDGLKSDNWPSTTHKHYGFADLSDLQTQWLDWVKKGCPPISKPESGALLAQRDAATKSLPAQRAANVIYRSQSPDRAMPVAAPAAMPMTSPAASQASSPVAAPAAQYDRPLEPVKFAIPSAAAPNRYSAPATELTPRSDDRLARNDLAKAAGFESQPFPRTGVANGGTNLGGGTGSDLTTVAPTSIPNFPSDPPAATPSPVGRYDRASSDIAARATPVTARRPGQVLFEWTRSQGAE